MRLRTLAGVMGAGALALGGVVSAQTQGQQQETPAAQPTSPAAAPDPIDAILQQTPPRQPVEEAPPAPGDVPAVVVTPAPAPIILPPPTPAATADQDDEEEAGSDDEAADEDVQPPPAQTEPAPTGRRARLPVAVIQALDKITAETMRFEVRVGGPPVRYKGLVFTARACEVTAPDELTEDAIAYLEIRSQPRGMSQQTPARQVFRGWMYASAPSVSGLEHPIYDAWVVECRA